MKIMQIMRSRHVFAVPRCPPHPTRTRSPAIPRTPPHTFHPHRPHTIALVTMIIMTIIYIMMTVMTITMIIVMMTTPVMMMMTNDATPAHIPPPTAPTHTTAALTRASYFSFSTTI